MTVAKQKKETFFQRIARNWKTNPMFSTGCVLVLMIIVQTIALGFNDASFGAWLQRWGKNWINILRNNAGVGIVALGMTFVIISGGIDLAVGSTMVAIGAVFNDPDLTRNSPPITITDFVTGAGGNDCEAVVYRRYPEVAAAASWLAQFGQARLTGTGACVFAAFPDGSSAERVLARLPAGWTGFVARGRNRSPLHEHLARRQVASV